MHFYGKIWSFRSCRVGFSVLYNKWHWGSERRYKNQLWGKFQSVNFDQGKMYLVPVSGEFELSEFELTEQNWLKIGVKSKGNRI